MFVRMFWRDCHPLWLVTNVVQDIPFRLFCIIYESVFILVVFLNNYNMMVIACERICVDFLFSTSTRLQWARCSGGSRISRRGGANLVGGCQLPRQLRFENFVCQNERIWTLGGRAPAAPPGSATEVVCFMAVSRSVLCGIIPVIMIFGEWYNYLWRGYGGILQ